MNTINESELSVASETEENENLEGENKMDEVINGNSNIVTAPVNDENAKYTVAEETSKNNYKDNEDLKLMREEIFSTLKNKSIDELKEDISQNIKDLSDLSNIYHKRSLFHKCVISDISWTIKEKCDEKGSNEKWIVEKKKIGDLFGKGNTNLEMCMRLARVEDISNYDKFGSTKLSKVITILQQNEAKLSVLENTEEENNEYKTFNLGMALYNFVSNAEDFTKDAIFKEDDSQINVG